MIESLKRLLSPEYLAVGDPGPMAGLWVVYVALGLLFACGLTGSVWLLLTPRNRTRPRVETAWAWYEFWICLAGLCAVLGRFLGWPGWSARIWPYGMALLASAGGLVYAFRWAGLPSRLAQQLRILALCEPHQAQEQHSAPAFIWTLGLLVHLGGIAFVLSVRYQLPAWLAPLILVLILLVQAPIVGRRRLPRLMALTPLLFAYAVAMLWWLYHQLGMTVIGWQGLAFPNPMVSLFYVDGIVLAMMAYALLCQLAVTASSVSKRSIVWRGATIGLLLTTLLWAGAIYFGKRTHGATASDPYAYAQMGVDLAENGTFLHRLGLFEDVMPLDIAWAPLQPVGYHIPRNELGDSPSVWATGASLFLAIGYLILGEVGLYVTTPLMALLALVATWALVQETLRGSPKAVRHLTAAIALALLATSPEHVDRLLVPMADAPAQLFTVLTLLFVLRGMRQLAKGHYGFGSFLLAGASFGLAYWVRHTQLVLLLPVLLATIIGVLDHRQSQRAAGEGKLAAHRSTLPLLVVPLLVFAAAAFVVALPDIAYRWQVFGGPFATETTELPLMHPRYIGGVAWQMLRDALASGEWGYLFPLALYGAYRLARDRQREAIVLGSAFVAVLLVHLTYHSLRLRDLISLFPLLDLAVAYGAVALYLAVRRLVPLLRSGIGSDLQPAHDRLGHLLLPAIVVAWIVLSLALSRWAMIDNLWKRGWASFGYMRVEHRQAFDQLAEITPPGAIVGASLNAGAIMMYSGRDAFRPYDSWTDAEWVAFLEAMAAHERPVYLLDDGGPMAEFIQDQRDSHELVPIEELQVPLFYTRDREKGWLYRLEPEQ